MYVFFAENFEVNEDEEVTLKGFLDLHAMTANDEEGGEDELWDVLQSMGYNKQLKLVMVISYYMPGICMLMTDILLASLADGQELKSYIQEHYRGLKIFRVQFLKLRVKFCAEILWWDMVAHKNQMHKMFVIDKFSCI